MIQLAGTLRQQARGRLQSLHEALDHAPGGRLEFHVFAVPAVFICELTGYKPGKLWCPTCSPRRATSEGSAERADADCDQEFGHK